VKSSTSLGLGSLGRARLGAGAAGVALIERDEPWGGAAEALGRARAGHGSVVLLDGPSGLGKTALLGAICELAEETHMEVLAAAGREREREFGWGVVLQLLETRISRADGDERARLLSEAAGPALPLFAPGPRQGLSEPAFALLHGLYRLCVNLASLEPLVLVVDDADLADLESLRFLLYLTERIENLPLVLVLATGRVAPSRRAPLLVELARHPATLRARLEPLSAEGTARRVREAWLPGGQDGLCGSIHEAAGGNPFLVDALAAELATAERENGRDSMLLPAPATIADWALERARFVDAAAPSLLSAAAVLGAGAELRHAAPLADLDVNAAAILLDGLVETGLFLHDERLTFAQPAVAAAVEAAQPPGTRAASHLRAARLLAAEDASPEEVAAHLLKGARTGSESTVEALCAAAAVALGRGAPADAVRYLRRALEEPPGRQLRAHVILELGRAEAIAGEPQAVLRLSEAIEHVSDMPERARTALATGRALFSLGRPTEATAVFERGLDEADTADPDVLARLQAAHATALWFGGLARAGDFKELPPAAGDTPGNRALLALHSMEGAMRGRPCAEVRELAERALGRGALLDEETADGLTYYLAAGALAIAEDLQTAEVALSAAVEDAQSRGSVLGFATASHVRSAAILMRGRVQDAAADARHALATESHGWRFGLAGARVVLANCHMERGDLVAAERALAEAEVDGWEHDPFLVALLSTRGRLRLLSGDPQQALDDFLACEELGERSGAANPAFSPWRSGAARAAGSLGDWSEAERLAEDELRLAEAFGAPGAIGRSLRALGTIRGGNAGLEALEAAVERLEASQTALERARALVDFGAALRRSGRRRDARDPLRAGLDLAQRCGAEVLAARAMEEAKVAGARPRRTALHGLDSLTTRERQVATLAAEGLSNREIAERLVVTVKTVEWHLKHTFRKLGVDSRHKLLDLLEPTER
jgi:DNA-binding CsgD family transcriptional regulator